MIIFIISFVVVNKYKGMKMRYKIDCKGNTCYRVYQQKSFLIFKWWSFMCKEVTLQSATTLIENLERINKH